MDKRDIQTERTLDSRHYGSTGLRAFFQLAELWNLSVKEQMDLLGLEAESTYYKWKKEPVNKLSRDTLERLSHVFSVYKDLQILFPNTQDADTWVKKPNTAPLFGGTAALEKMRRSVGDLYEVRRYLDAVRGGW